MVYLVKHLRAVHAPQDLPVFLTQVRLEIQNGGVEVAYHVTYALRTSSTATTSSHWSKYFTISPWPSIGVQGVVEREAKPNNDETNDLLYPAVSRPGVNV